MSQRIERAIDISSVERKSSGVSRCDDFVIKFTPALLLDNNQKHEIALDQISMTYSWHNVTTNYGNNTIKYSHDGGSTWTTVTFPNGMYSYQDLNDYIHQIMKRNGHVKGDQYDINIIFILTTYKVIIELSNKYQIDFRNTKFGELLGFDPKLIESTQEGSKLPNITNSIDLLNINTDIISDSIVGGSATDTLYVIPTGILNRSFPFVEKAVHHLFTEVSTSRISRMRVYVTDSLRRPVDLNGIDWHMRIILRST